MTFDGLASFLLQRLKFREIYLQFSLKSWRSTFWQVFSSSFAILGNFFLIFFKILTNNVLTSFLFQVPHVGTNVSWYVCFAEYSTMIRTSKFRPKILRLLVLFQKTNMIQWIKVISGLKVLTNNLISLIYLNYIFAALLEGKKNILIFEQNFKVLIVVYAVSSCAHCTRCILFSPNLDNGTKSMCK